MAEVESNFSPRAGYRVLPFNLPPAVAAGRPQSRDSPWVRGPIWDSVWMLSALWLVPVAWWLSHGDADPKEGPLDLLYFGLTALFWLGHRLSSTYLAYCTEAYRPLLRTQPVRFVVIPLLVTAGCFAVFLPADEALPWSREQRLVTLAIVDYVFVTYHFASQHFGALALYRTRGGRAGCVHTRMIDRMFALGVGGVLVVLADILAGVVAYQDRWEGWVLPEWLFSAQHGIRAAAMVVLGVATAAMLVIEIRAPRWSPPRLLYMLGLAGMVVIALQPRSVFLFLVLWTSQHWILATGLASLVPAAEPKPAIGTIRPFLHGVNVRPWAVLAIQWPRNLAPSPGKRGCCVPPELQLCTYKERCWSYWAGKFVALLPRVCSSEQAQGSRCQISHPA